MGLMIFSISRVPIIIGDKNVIILSSPSKVNTSLCIAQKRKWLDEHIGLDIPAIFEKEKHKYAAPDRLLIDDTESKVDAWRKAGGQAILFKNWDQCKEELGL